jgi:hypothetical protein
MRNIISKAETPRDRFVRLATIRTNSVLRSLRILGNCSNKYVYEYSDSDIQKIFGEIDKALRETKSKFRGIRKKEFRL